MDVAIRTSAEKGNADLTLLVSTTPIRSYGRTMALVFVEDVAKFRSNERNKDCQLRSSV
jgi:hypothetical protein